MNDNTVTMNLVSYNQIKAENTKFQMFMSRIFEDAELKPDYSGIKFDPQKLEDIIHLCYPDTYKKKLASLRGQQMKMSLQKLDISEPKEETNCE